jgi:hypothetical protein
VYFGSPELSLLFLNRLSESMIAMNWGPIVGEIASWLTSLGITGLVAGAGAWGLFKWLGTKWIEDHFVKELEAFKAEKQVELEKLKTEYGRETERLKAELNRFADRASRFHLREYEVLPEAWGLMNKAYGAAASTISSIQQHPDLDRMGKPQFAAWLDQSGLEQYQKDDLNSASDKNQSYMKMHNWRQISEANISATEFMNYIILQGVFIDEQLGQKMAEAGQNIRKALISRSMAARMDEQPYADGQTDFFGKAGEEISAVEPVVVEVKQEVRRLLSNIRLVPEVI